MLGGAVRVNADGSDSDGPSEIHRFSSASKQDGHADPDRGQLLDAFLPDVRPITAQVSPDGTKVVYGIYEYGGARLSPDQHAATLTDPCLGWAVSRLR